MADRVAPETMKAFRASLKRRGIPTEADGAHTTPPTYAMQLAALRDRIEALARYFESTARLSSTDAAARLRALLEPQGGKG